MLVALVEAQISPVFSSLFSTARGLSEVCQRETYMLVRNIPRTHTCSLSPISLDRLELVLISRCWEFRREEGRLKTDFGRDRLRANSPLFKLLSVSFVLSFIMESF